MRQLRTVWFLALVALSGGAHAQKYPQPIGRYPDDTLPSSQPDGVPHTLSQALGIAYETNPQLTGERAHLRSTDENVPTALAGWRPQVSIQGSYGAAVGRFDEFSQCGTTGFGIPGCYSNNNPKTGTYIQTNEYPASIENNRTIKTIQGNITQYLYRGGHTVAQTHEAVNSVYAERARLIAEEETVFNDTITAYVTYVEDDNLLSLDRQNEQVLGDELRAIEARFRVGELTRTDVAQAEAALAQAIAQRQTAEGTLQTARATFVREVGVEPPRDIADPQPLRLPVQSEQAAADLAVRNNPNIIAALFNQAELLDAVDVAFSALGPQLSLQGQVYDLIGQSLNKQATYGATGVIALTLPIYQGGAEYAAVRQARQNYQQAVRQTEDARRMAREQAVQAWDTLVAARASIGSSRVAVQSAKVALEGVEREALVGSATTQDVLIQQQNLLTAEITLVQNITSLVTASYGVANAIGRLTARDLGLAVPLYDETAYYNAVRDRLWGTADRAVRQPGR